MTNRIRNRRINNKKIDMTSYLRHVQKEREEQTKFFRILTIMTIVFVAVLVSIFIFADNENFLEKNFGENSVITKVFQKLTKGNAKKEKADFSLPFGLRRQNILFLGVDASGNPKDLWSGTRTDTILLVNIDPRTKSINAISIPRDSKVYLPHGKGVNKINAAHALGGLDMTIETIEDTFGVHVDKYIMVHDKAVEEIINAMDGIDIYVEKPMRYHDYSGNLHIDLSKGEHHLNGREAVGYLRFRHDALGDIGRTQRQQWFMRGLLDSLKSPKTITKIPEIISVAKKYVKTDMSLYEMSQYAALAKHIDMNKIEIATLPGTPNQKGYISYWILDPAQTQATINRLIYREHAKFDETVPFSGSVMYSNDRKEDADRIIEELKAVNVDVKCQGHVNRTHSQFIAHSNKVTNEYYNWLNKKAPSTEGFQFVYDPLNLYCTDTDFTIVLTGKK